MNHWLNYRIWSTWIVGGRYITVLSSHIGFADVLETVMQYVEEHGALIPEQPVVLVAHNIVEGDDYAVLQALPEGSVTINL